MNSPTRRGPNKTLILAALLLPGICPASDIAKQLANPIASLIRGPLQFNWDDNFGLDDGGKIQYQDILTIRVLNELINVGGYFLFHAPDAAAQ